MILALDRAVQLHKSAEAIQKLRRKQAELRPPGGGPAPAPANAADQNSDPLLDSSSSASTEELAVLERLGREYLRLLREGGGDGQPMEPQLSVRLLHAFTEVDFHPGFDAKGLLVSREGWDLGGEGKRLWRSLSIQLRVLPL